MYWAFILLIILVVYFAIQAIIKISLKKILSNFLQNFELTYGRSSFFSILKLVGENNFFSIEIINLQLKIDFFALFDIIQKSPFHLQFDKFNVCIKEDLKKLKKNTDKKEQKTISFKFWIFQKVIFFLTPLLIRKFSFNLNNIQIKIEKLNATLKIKNITELFKISHNYVHNELRILSILVQLSDISIIQIPVIRLSLNSDINILKILMVTAVKRLSFSIELLTVQFSKGLSSLNFKNVIFFMSSDNQVKCSIEIKPITIFLPIISIDHHNLVFYFNNINGNLSKIKCSDISAISRDSQLIKIQQVGFSSRNLNVSSINVDLSYHFMLTAASLIQIVYKNEPKLPKIFKFPLNVNCNFVHFKIDLSDYHKIDMNFQKGFKFIGDNETYNSNNNYDIPLHTNENNDLCALIIVPKGTCSTFDRDCNVYRPLMKVSKAEVEVINSKFFKIFAKSYDFFVSPMFAYMPYFKIIGKCFSHLMSIIKGPNFVQFEDYPPTLVHFIFNIKTFRLIFLKHELAAKISQSIDAKTSTISDLQLRLQKFFQIMRNNQVKEINNEEVDKVYKEIRFKLYREALKKIHDHDEDNNNEKFATFVMKNVILDIDGFHFKSKKDIIKSLTEDEKYQSLKLTKESIGKINSVKLVIQMDALNIFSNINTQFPQYEICKMRKIYYGIEFHFIDKKAKSNRDYFLNELTLNGEKIIIPILSSEPLLIYDKLVFTFNRFSFDFIPSFTSYYQDSMIMISKIFSKLVPYPKIALFDNLRMRNVIYGSMKFTKLKLHIMPKPKSSLTTITFYDLEWKFVNPLNHVFVFERFSVNLKNKELFMSFPSMVMDAKLAIKNKNFKKENEIVPFPFVEVNSVKMLQIGYDPYEMSRSHQIDFTIEMKFPNSENKKQTKSNPISSIELNFDYLSTLIDKFLIKKKFVFEKVNHLFVKSVKKRNPIVQNYKVILALFPPINIHFTSYTINVNLNNINFEKIGEKNEFSFKSVEFWFLRMKNMHTGTLSLTDISGTTFTNKNIYPSQYEIKKFRFEIYDKFLIHFFLKLASVMRNVLSNSAKAESISNGSRKTHSLLSLNTKAEEERRQRKYQKMITDQKCTRLNPETSLSELYSIFQIPSLLVFLNEATIEFYHRSFTVSPSISFNKLSLEGRKSTKLSGGRMNIIKFEQFTAEILQKKGFPFIKAKEMELDVLLSMDRLFFTAQLKKGMDMNIQSDAISLTTSELFSNLPKIEQIFNDENFIKFMNQRQQAQDDKKKEAEKKKQNSLSLNYNSTSEQLFNLNDKENENDISSSSFDNALDNNNNEILVFSKQFSLFISSNIEINLIDSDFNSIATLKSNKIAYTYIFKDNMTETQNIVIGDLEVCNNTASGKDKQTGEPTRYYKFLKVINNNNNENKFLEMNILKNLNLMKLPFFSKVSIKIKPIEVNISREFINVLVGNFKLFSKFNVFDFDKMKKYFIQMKQKSKSNNEQQQDDDDDNDDSVAAAAAAAVSSNPDENPYGFYGTVEVADMKLKMSILIDNATIFRSFENRALNIDKIVVNDLFATKERILKLVKKKITLDILKSIPTLFISEKDKK